jgi:hypothetical protein
MRNSIFKLNYLNELPDDIKQYIYKCVYKDVYAIVLNEMHANIDNLKYYNILKYLLINQKEPKLNLLKYFSQNFNKHIEHNESVNVKNISFYKKHLISSIISKSNINKIKIVSNMFLYLDKKIAQPFINSMKNSIDNMYIDDNGVYFVLEYDRFFCCYAEIYLMSLSLWQHIRRKLYEFYELHMEAYKIHINNLIKDEYGYEIYLRDNYNINDDNFDYNLEKIKRENVKLYRKIAKHRSYVDNTESFYVNFEICNIIDTYIIKDDSIIIKFIEL